MPVPGWYESTQKPVLNWHMKRDVPVQHRNTLCCLAATQVAEYCHLFSQFSKKQTGVQTWLQVPFCWPNQVSCLWSQKVVIQVFPRLLAIIFFLIADSTKRKSNSCSVFDWKNIKISCFPKLEIWTKISSITTPFLCCSQIFSTWIVSKIAHRRCLSYWVGLRIIVLKNDETLTNFNKEKAPTHKGKGRNNKRGPTSYQETLWCYLELLHDSWKP